MAIEDILRLINSLLIIIWFGYMWSLHLWWATRPLEERLVLACMPLLLLLVLFSSGESLIQNLGFGARLLLITPVLILCIISSDKLARKLRKLNKEREEDNNDQ